MRKSCECPCFRYLLLSWPVEHSWQLGLRSWNKSRDLTKCFFLTFAWHTREEFNLKRLQYRDKFIIWLCTDKEGKGPYISDVSLSLSLSGIVNASCCCLCLLCSAWVDQCLLLHCRWRPSQVIRSYRMCLKSPHTQSHTQTRECPHIQYKHREMRTPTKTHTLCLHTCLSCFISPAMRFKPKAF